MTLNEWIEQYCQENEIELPEDIADGDTALNYLILNAGGGGGSNGNLVKINCEYNVDDVYVLDKTFAELYEMCISGEIAYFTVVEDEEFTTLDNSYAYVSTIYTLSKVYKYDTLYRVCFNSSSTAYYNNMMVAKPSTIIFECDNSQDFPVYYIGITTNEDNISETGLPW